MIITNGAQTIYRDLLSLLRRQLDFYNIRPRCSTIYLTYRCNSKCKTCSMWQRPQEEEKQKELGLAAWKKVVDKMADAGITTLEIFGGNVLLRKEVLIPLLQYLYEKKITIHLPTNQMGLDTDIAEAIVRYVDRIYISTDGLGADQDEIRGINGAFSLGEGTVEKLLRLRSLIERDPNTTLVCNCTVSKFNHDKMEDILQYAVDKGFDEVHFEYVGEFNKCDLEKSRVLGVTPEPHYLRQDESVLADKEEAAAIKRIIAPLRKKYKKSGILINTINIESLSVKNLWEGTIPHKKCYIERNEVTIDPYGNITACPFITNFILGNLVDSELGEIWNNKKHNEFRKIQNSYGLPMCRHCILGVQRNPGVMKTLQRIYFSRIRDFVS